MDEPTARVADVRLEGDDLAWLASLPAAANLSDHQRHVLIAMHHGRTWTNQSFREAFSTDSRQARAELGGLVDRGVVTGEGRRHAVVYRLSADFSQQQ